MPTDAATPEDDLQRFRDYLHLIARLQLAHAVAQLPEDQRQVIGLHHLRGHSSAAVCAETGRSEASVAGLLRRGLKRLHELLGENEQE